MNNDLITKTGNKFPVFNFGSDLMNLKFLIVLTMVLCAFCVFPVNAANLITVDYSGSNSFELGTIDDLSLDIAFKNFPYNIYCGVYDEYNLTQAGQTGKAPNQQQNEIVLHAVLDSESNNAGAYGRVYNFNMPSVTQTTLSIVINYQYSSAPLPPSDDFDIDIDLQEQTIELGEINNLEQTFDIGSTSERVIQRYTSYASMSCTIDDLQRNYVKIKFDKDYNYAEIFLSGNALKGSTVSDFTTQVKFNYTYVQGLQAFIQTYDYQNGNMLSGVNMSIYEVIEGDNGLELGNLIYSSSNSESQTILNLKQDTDYFIENDLNGYYAVKNENIASLDNRYGYLWNPTLSNPLRLYYSRLDASAQYNANFIVQDVNNNGISGVSVTMDNAVTKITNSIGGLTFNNVSAGTHTFVFIKNGYQTAQQTIDIQLQYAAFYQTMYKDNQIVQPTVSPSLYPTVQPTVQPTISPIDQPTNLGESIKYGLAKMFGVNSLNTINLIFALLIILFPAVVGAVVTNQALGFISGGLIGFVFALGIGLIPIWVFFSMIMLSVIYLVMTHTEAGF